MTNNISEAAQIKIVQIIAKELGVGPHQVAAAVALLDEGSTVPFIARYRKEATGNLDDTHLRNLDERLLYLRELEERRAVILTSIERQGKLTDELRGAIETAATKQALEDIYLPYKPKRRTRAQMAREAGLEPLADALFADPTLDPQQEAAKYVNVTPATESSNAINVPDAQAALDGAREILCERFAETAELLAKLRTRMWEQGIVTSTVMKGKETAEEEKFRDYYAYSEAIRTIPSHRALALFRGESLAVLKIELGLGEEIEAAVPHPCVAMISIGNGTASRETDKLAAEVIELIASKMPERKLNKIVVSEAGASVYSASAFAASEFPELDVSLRGAVSIARRLQDPLAELVKIDPKSIGVGQYQHDVNQRALARALDATVEDCVNAVGVDVNTASAPLLARVSGLNRVLAKNVVEYRDSNGPFPNRKKLRKVPRLGDKSFEQAAGFLRINHGDNPLDRSSVHPEAYPIVERIPARISKGIGEVMGQPAALKGLSPAEFTDDKFGVPTVRDILTELEKPGRDPRPEFKTATFQERIESLADLQPIMLLDSIYTNVSALGAFVDIDVQ